jgi:phage terminase large subunit
VAHPQGVFKAPPDGKPGLLVFDTCETLIRSLPALLHSDTNPSDAAAEPHEYTHGPDAVRYLCSYRTLGARREEPRQQDAQEEFDDAMRAGR